jgi:hypothetical protein
VLVVVLVVVPSVLEVAFLEEPFDLEGPFLEGALVAFHREAFRS